MLNIQPNFLRYLLLGALLWSALFSLKANATMIVVIYTKDGYWIGADSYRAIGGKHEMDVCKLHETPFGIVAKAGDSQGVTEQGKLYSTDKEVEDILASTGSSQEFKSRLKMQFKHDLEEELVFILDIPRDSNLENQKMRSDVPSALVSSLARDVILFDTKRSTEEELLVQPGADKVEIQFPPDSFYVYWAPATRNWHPIDESSIVVGTSRLVHQFIYAVPYQKSDSWIEKNPKQALIEILSKGHLAQKEQIGPPYTILRVKIVKDGEPRITWISKGKCPGWFEDTDQRDTHIQLRDEIRRGTKNYP